MSEIVILDWLEVHYASVIALLIHNFNRRRNAKPRYGAPKDGGEQLGMCGIGGERAVSRAFNLEWPYRIGDFEAVDVGGLIEVRTRSPFTGRDLPLHPPDREDYPWVLVIEHEPTEAGLPFELVGWVWGSEGKDQAYWSDGAPGRPAFWVPRRALHPLDELRALLKEHWQGRLPAEDERPWAGIAPPKKAKQEAAE